MTLPACFFLADEVFPRVRAEASRRLVRSGWSQTRAADALRVSQAMVSKYVARTEEESDAMVLRMTDEFLQSLDDPATVDGPSPWCQTLVSMDARPEAQDALADILAAERTLTMEPPIAVVPQIGLNIARAVPDASGPEDILAFPGRMVAAGDQLVSPVPPAWGASQHLASCLLALQSADPTAHAIANIRGDTRTQTAARNIGLQPTTIDRSDASIDDPVTDAFRQGHRCVVDPGAHGIEPCLYIAGATAQEVAATIHSTHDHLQV